MPSDIVALSVASRFSKVLFPISKAFPLALRASMLLVS